MICFKNTYTLKLFTLKMFYDVYVINCYWMVTPHDIKQTLKSGMKDFQNHINST